MKAEIILLTVMLTTPLWPQFNVPTDCDSLRVTWIDTINVDPVEYQVRSNLYSGSITQTKSHTVGRNQLPDSLVLWVNVRWLGGGRWISSEYTSVNFVEPAPMPDVPIYHNALLIANQAADRVHEQGEWDGSGNYQFKDGRLFLYGKNLEHPPVLWIWFYDSTGTRHLKLDNLQGMITVKIDGMPYTGDVIDLQYEFIEVGTHVIRISATGNTASFTDFIFELADQKPPPVGVQEINILYKKGGIWE